LKTFTAAMKAVHPLTLSETAADFTAETKGAFADELRFTVPKGPELLVDDVLLFEP
jgi:hypothetical protein